MAACRTLGARLPAEARLASDPYGASFAPAPLEWLVRHLPGPATVPAWPFVLYMQVRTRAIDDVLRRFVADGGTQVLILGAGYDCRAARFADDLTRTHVFEVDHPATQASKREQLGKLAGYPVDAARYVTCNFEREDPIERLVACGFSQLEPALVIWEGVVPYLTEGAIRATASRLATGLDPRSLVAFDFVGKKLATGQGLNDKDLKTRDYVGELGEPIRYGTDDILPLLHDCGFRWVRVLDFNELALEFLGDYQRERQFRFQRVALAATRVPDASWP